MNGLTRALPALGSTRFLLVLGLAAVVIGILIFLATRMTQPPMSLLYGELDTADSGKIVAKLEALTVPYELRAGGSQIFVPSDKALRLRMAMAEEGLPSGGSVGYEVFDRSDTLGSTRTMQNINLLRALEGELARTIRALAQISAARVHLVLPKRELFARERQQPSASIMLTVQGAASLGKSRVSAIQHLVAAAVPGLKPSRISIIDHRGTLLARGTEGDDGDTASLFAQDQRAEFESRLKRMIEGLLERSVGIGKVRAEVSADIDFDRITTSAEIFDPDGQVVRSSQLVEEETSSAERGAQENVSVSNNLPDGEAQAAAAASNVNATTRTEETTNYEISKTIRNHVRESGTVKRISVAVLVDGTYAAGSNGERVFEARSAEDMEQLGKLVRSAIGFDAERGDTVEIVNMPFVQVEAPEVGEAPLLDLVKGDYFKIAEMAALSIVGVLIVLLVLRPLATYTLNPPPLPAAEDQAQAALPGPAGAVAQLPGGADAEEEDSIDFDRIEGKVKESSLKKIGEIVDSHPDEALTIIRNWLYQEA